MEQTPQIDEETLANCISKYKTIFETRFNKLTLSVYFTSNGQPPTPDDCRSTPETTKVTGLFVKVGRDYRIGIYQNQPLKSQLLAFFHEYGHAVYRREASEPIDNEYALIRTETAALSKSLELADIEGLPEIAILAVRAAILLSELAGPVYLAAMNNVKNSPLWLKYSQHIR